jgi:hypothetical protein
MPKKPPKFKAPLRYPEFIKYWNSDVGIYIRNYQQQVGNVLISMRVPFSEQEASHPESLERKFTATEIDFKLEVNHAKRRQNIT